jgi:hypothetical protein
MIKRDSLTGNKLAERVAKAEKKKRRRLFVGPTLDGSGILRIQAMQNGICAKQLHACGKVY